MWCGAVDVCAFVDDDDRMARRNPSLTDALDDYLCSFVPPEPAAMTALRTTTAALGSPAVMQVSPYQAHAMVVLLKLIGARRHLEIGTFTGGSACAVALAGIDVVTCDVSAEWTAVAQQAWSDAGVAARITLKLAPASATMDALIKEGAVFDSIFIDADKPGYDAYWERGLKLVRSGGLLLVDNTLWNGQVVDDADITPNTVAIKAVNRKVGNDPRVDAVLLPIGDGLTVARKK